MSKDDFLLIEDPEADREDRIVTACRYYQVGRQVAEIMIDTGYSKGTANRILADRRRKESRDRERAALAEIAAAEEKSAKSGRKAAAAA
jgi:endonuclease YncB( thermonuclease family)